jgi:hypothetical protein
MRQDADVVTRGLTWRASNQTAKVNIANNTDGKDKCYYVGITSLVGSVLQCISSGARSKNIQRYHLGKA